MSPRRPSRIHGLLPVNKRPGPTSHDVVDMARKALGERRIGHTGTLDPAAEGLLLLCVGQATRLQQYLLGWDKTYRGRIRLGHATTTYDGQGEPTTPQGLPPEVADVQVRELENRFSGEIDQLPPPYSAKKVGGRKLYELARGGEEVPLEPKRVTVHRLALRSVAADVLEFEVTCSSGFYVRSLAHDLGIHLGCGGFLEHLERTCIGPYRVEDAVPQEGLRPEAHDELLASPAWQELSRVHLPFVEVALNPGAEDRFVHGQEVVLMRGDGEPVDADALVTVRGSRQRLLGVGTVHAVLARGRTVCVRPSLVLSPPGDVRSR